MSPTSVVGDISHSGVSSVIERSHQTVQDQIQDLERKLQAPETHEAADAANSLEMIDEVREERLLSAESRCTLYETGEEEARHFVIHNVSSDLEDKAASVADPQHRWLSLPSEEEHHAGRARDG